MRIGITCGLAVLAMALGARDSRAAEIRWKLAKGDVLRYKMTADQKTTQDLGRGDPFDTAQRSTIVWRLAVQEVDPAGNARILCRFEAVAIDMDQMMIGRVAWDSTKKEDAARADDPVIQPFAQLVGKEFNFGMSASGRVTDVRGYEDVARALLSSVKDNPLAQAALASGFGDEAVRASLEGAFAVVPKAPVERGATWQRTSERRIPLLGTLRYATEFRLDDLEAGGARARIGAKTRLDVVEPAGTEAAADLAKRLDVEWKGGGGEATIAFGVEAGRLERSESRVEMTLRSKARPPVAPGEGPGAVGVDVKVRQLVVVELLPPT
jgi:hypothetical protein